MPRSSQTKKTAEPEPVADVADDELDVVDLAFTTPSASSFRVDDVVLAQINHWPWWPARILSVTKTNSVYVKFFNDVVNNRVLIANDHVRRFQREPPDIQDEAYIRHAPAAKIAYREALDYLLACIPKEEEPAPSALPHPVALSPLPRSSQESAASSQSSSQQSARNAKRSASPDTAKDGHSDGVAKRECIDPSTSTTTATGKSIGRRGRAAALTTTELIASTKSSPIRVELPPISVTDMPTHLDQCNIDKESQATDAVDAAVRRRAKKYTMKKVSACLTPELGEELLKIHRGETSSERHAEFHQPNADHGALVESMTFGPILDQNAQGAVSTWLAELLPGFEHEEYIRLVLVHEAVTRIIQAVENCPLDQARQLITVEYLSASAATKSIETYLKRK